MDVKKQKTEENGDSKETEVVEAWACARPVCSSVLPPGQHHSVELVLFCPWEVFFVAMLSHCTGVLKHSGPASFFMKYYLLVFKMSFFFYLYNLGHSKRSVFFCKVLYHVNVRSTASTLVLTRWFIHTGSCWPQRLTSRWPLRFTIRTKDKF